MCGWWSGGRKAGAGENGPAPVEPGPELLPGPPPPPPPLLGGVDLQKHTLIVKTLIIIKVHIISCSLIRRDSLEAMEISIKTI